jgi:hypothetical protein
MISTSDYIQAFAGAFLIGTAVSYAWWAKLRLIYFREDLFQIRDKLWMAAQRANAFDDPMYQKERARINACLSGATLISLPMMLYMLAQGEGSSFAPAEKSKISDAINEARSKLVKRIGRFVFLDRFLSGIVLAALLSVPIGIFLAIGKLLTPTKQIPSPRRVSESWVSGAGPKEVSLAANQMAQLAA